MSGTPGYMHERHLEMGRLGISWGVHHRDYHLEVGMHGEEIAAGPKWAQFPGNCIWFEGGGGGAKCRPVKREQL